MSEFKFDPNHFSEAHAAEIDAAMAPVYDEFTAAGIDRLLKDATLEMTHANELTIAEARRGSEEAEQFANLGLIDGEMPHNIGAAAERMLITEESLLAIGLRAMLEEVDPQPHVMLDPRTGQPIDSLSIPRFSGRDDPDEELSRNLPPQLNDPNRPEF